MFKCLSVNPKGSTTRRGLVALALTLFVGSVSCRREVSAAEMKENANVPAAAEPVAGPAPAARFDEAAFTLSIEPQGAYVSGQPCAANVKLVAKGPHHVNQEYPHKLKLKAVDGVTYAQPVVARDSMKVEMTQAQFAVPFTPTRSGKVTIGGDFAFSLCTADRCLIEKRPIELEIQVP